MQIPLAVLGAEQLDSCVHPSGWDDIAGTVGERWKRKHVCCHSDNMAIVSVFKRTTTSQQSMLLLSGLLCQHLW